MAEAWKEMLVFSESDYDIGYYNGIERMQAVLENRKPSFLVPVGEKRTTTEEKETKNKRTMATGIRRKVEK